MEVKNSDEDCASKQSHQLLFHVEIEYLHKYHVYLTVRINL